MTRAFRLRRGEDLRRQICACAAQTKLQAAVVLCAVGCLSQWRVRGADGKSIFSAKERVEIVSLTGTVSAHGCHLHVSLAREDLSVFGGHLLDGCLVNTTAEISLLALEGITFIRAPDASTGYNELLIRTNEEAES